jgi:hypothetical protein
LNVTVATRFGTFFGTLNFGGFGTNFFRFGNAIVFLAPQPEVVLSIGISVHVFLATFVRFGTIFVCFSTAPKILYDRMI